MINMSLDVRGYSESFDYSDFNSLDKSNDNRVQAWLENEHPRRGDIQVLLTSPQQTSSVLLPFRRHDFVNADGYSAWAFMSVRHWGENPLGQWTLGVIFNSSEGFTEVSGIKMDLFGTSEVPESVKGIPTHCDTQCARGCSGEGPQNCDVCRQLRVATTLECVAACPLGTTISEHHPGYCLFGSGGNSTQNNTETTASGSTSESGVQSTPSSSAAVVIGVTLAGSFLVLILLATLVLLLCALAYVGLSKRPFKYKAFNVKNCTDQSDSSLSSRTDQLHVFDDMPKVTPV